MQPEYFFPEVTLLITHFNRSASLHRLLAAFKNQGFVFGDIVVSDDSSKDEHQNALNELQAEFKFRLIATPVNKGLGNNLNKGQDAVKTPYTLYIQEDFVPKPGFAIHLQNSLQFLKDDIQIDMVRYYAYHKYPFLKPYGKGFCRMVFSPYPWYAGYRKFYYYSDHPHLRRSDFFSKFGRYAEGEKTDVTEYKMMLAFIQKKGQGLFYERFQDLFDQINSADEPSTVKRSPLRQSNNFFILPVKHVFRYVKFYFNYNFRTYN